jgi:hypothetical protein
VEPLPFPIDPDDVEAWAQRTGRPLADSQRRYAHYLALRSICDNQPLARQLTFQGGGTAAYVFHCPRTPRDLDFYLRGRPNELVGDDEKQRVIQQVGTALSVGMRKFCPKFDQWRDRLKEMIKVELYGTHRYFDEKVAAIGQTGIRITIISAASIVGAKYALLLFDELRRERRHPRMHKDLFDLAALIRNRRDRMDIRVVTRSLMTDKDFRWTPDVSLQAAMEVMPLDQVRANYKEFKQFVGNQYFDFEEAWTTVLDYYELVRKQDVSTLQTGPASY